MKLGIVALLEAKPGKEGAVAELLKGAVALASQEAGTLAWYAFQAGPRSFGIFDTFADEAGRTAHLQGEIGPPVVLRHNLCGHEADPLLVCAHCHEELRPREVTPERGPGVVAA